MNTPEIFDTKVTHLGRGIYGCRIIMIKDQSVVVETRVTKNQISDAIFTMLRTLDKMGYMSPMAHATRQRQNGRVISVKFIW